MLQPKDVDYVIYHKNCSDGIGSALAAWVFSKGIGISYHAASIGTDPPTDIVDKNVLICDFCYPIATLRTMLKVVKNLLVIDHHKTSAEDLATFPEDKKLFDMKRSGAMMTWQYFYSSAAATGGEDSAPLLIRYIQDNDIWTKEMPETDIFYSWLATVPKTFEEYGKYLNDAVLLETFRKDGAIIKKVNDFYIEQALDYVHIHLCEINDRFYWMAETNMPILQSPLGNRMMQRFPYIDFSVVFNINKGVTGFCLRSTNDHADVSQIAKFYGGGGHRNAAGVKMFAALSSLPCKKYDVQYSTLERVKRATIAGLPAVIVCCPQDKAVLAQYLVQRRWIGSDDKDRKNNQNAAFILGGEPVALAVVWSYNAEFRKTVFVAAFADTLNKDQTAKICADLGFNSDRRLVVDGLRETL